MIAAASVAGCGGGGARSTPAPQITVTVSPASVSVPLGGTLQFTATVGNTSNTAVSWSVNGVTSGNAMMGTIDGNGLYTAPQNLPSPSSVTIRATSAADASRSGSAALTVTSDLTVTVMPGAGNVELGATLQFAATVAGSGNPNRAVNWGVNGVAGGNAMVGTVSTAGFFTAPQILPAPATVTLTATSQADPAKFASVMLTITSTFSISVSGPAVVVTAASATYVASITPAAMSNPSTMVNWSVDGVPGGNSTVGTINAAGIYTAPLVAPAAGSVTITATAAADPAKSASQLVTINTMVGIMITPSPALNIALENSQQFTAVVSGTLNQNVVWDVNGIIGGDLIVGTINNPGSGAIPATYTAPVNMPGVPVTVRATSVFDNSQQASTSVTFFSNITVGITPTGATRAVGRIQTLTASAANTSNSNVEWRVNGVLGGDATNGRICVAGFQPCTRVTTPMAAGPVDYEAPGSLPPINPVNVTASSQADPSKSGSALVNIVANVSVAVSPASVAVPVNGNLLFTASVIGSPNQGVTWTLTGAGCSGALCGTLTQQSASTASYNAPSMMPSPNTVTITATSNDGMQTGTATVTIVTTFISSLLPASVTAGAQSPFVLRVRGFNFVLGNPSAEVLVNGVARTTACQTFTSSISTHECNVTLAPADVAAAGNLDITVQNPGAPATPISNTAQLVIVADAATEDVIALTAGAPAAGNKDISAVEPTSAGTGPQQADITLLGAFASGICNVQSSSITVTRPAGAGSLDICVVGNTLTGAASETYTLSGPGDITVGAVIPGGVIRMTLNFAANVQPGTRTLFVKTANKDKAAASGAIVVK